MQLDNGARYVPNGGSQGVQLLRKGINAFDEAIRIWSGPTDDPDSGTKGYDRIVDHASANVEALRQEVAAAERERQARVQRIREEMRAGKRERLSLPELDIGL